MVIVGFTNKTSKILPRILCRRFRHCAPIIIGPNGDMEMYQFVSRGNVVKISINMRDIRILRKHGWVFVCMPYTNEHLSDYTKYKTCVSMTSNLIGMPRRHPFTPYGLYKKITAKWRDFL